MIQNIGVTGMTCQNCVRHVTEALEALPGVRSVAVRLESSTARIEGDREVPRPELQAALEGAGYALA